MAGKKGMTHYSLETKLQAVHLHLDEGLTYAQVTARLGLRTARRLEGWVACYQQAGLAGLNRRGSGRPCKGGSPAERIAQLEMENALLKKFHTELRKGRLARRDIGSSNTTEAPTR